MHVIFKIILSRHNLGLALGFKAFVAAAVVCLVATTVRAGSTRFIMDESASILTLGGTVDVSDVFGEAPGTFLLPIHGQAIDFNPANGPAPASGLVSHYSGLLDANLTGTPAAGSISLVDNGPGYIHGTGSGGTGPAYNSGGWIPDDDGLGNPVRAPYGLGEYGTTVSALSSYTRMSDIQVTPSTFWATSLGNPTNASSVSGTVFAVGGGMMLGIAHGEQFEASDFSGDSYKDLATSFGGANYPIPMGGTLDFTSGTPIFFPNATVGIWNGTTLTLNVNGSVRYLLFDAGPEDLVIPITQTWNGQLVFTLAPEPSTFALGGIGCAAMIACVRRRRQG